MVNDRLCQDCGAQPAVGRSPRCESCAEARKRDLRRHAQAERRRRRASDASQAGDAVEVAAVNRRPSSEADELGRLRRIMDEARAVQLALASEVHQLTMQPYGPLPYEHLIKLRNDLAKALRAGNAPAPQWEGPPLDDDELERLRRSRGALLDLMQGLDKFIRWQKPRIPQHLPYGGVIKIRIGLDRALALWTPRPPKPGTPQDGQPGGVAVAQPVRPS